MQGIRSAISTLTYQKKPVSTNTDTTENAAEIQAWAEKFLRLPYWITLRTRWKCNHLNNNNKQVKWQRTYTSQLTFVGVCVKNRHVSVLKGQWKSVTQGWVLSVGGLWVCFWTMRGREGLLFCTSLSIVIPVPRQLFPLFSVLT